MKEENEKSKNPFHLSEQQTKPDTQDNSPLKSRLCDVIKKRSLLTEGWQAKPDGVLENNKGIFKTYKSLPYNPKLKERAKQLRKAGNLSEVLFWNQVKRKKFLALDFHRQKIIGNYIVDFYCPKLNLVIEIDGSSHNDKIEYDEERERYLKSLNLEMLHFTDKDIKHNLNGVLEYLAKYCKEANTPSLRDTPLKEGNTLKKRY